VLKRLQWRWKTANMAKKGVTASGYGTVYTWQIRTVSYSPVGDKVIPPNTKNTSLGLEN